MRPLTLPGRGVALPAPIHTPRPRNVSTHQRHQPGSAPQNTPHKVKPVLCSLLLSNNRFCLFCTQKQQGSISIGPQTKLSGEGICRPRVLPSPACLHPCGVLPTPQPPSPHSNDLLQQETDRAPAASMVPSDRRVPLVLSPQRGTPSLSQPKKASAKSQDGPKSLPGSLPALDPAH